MKKRGWASLRYAFPRTVPVMVGYLFLGMAYGILMSAKGFGIWWSLAMSVFVYAGSLQYVGASLLAAAVHPVSALMMGLMINARHLFYGISMLDKYKEIKRFKPYLIFALTDETFSVLCQEEPPGTVDRDLVYLFVAALNQAYWVAGTAAGAILGNLIRFNTKGLDFALTALFVVIFTDQWNTQKDHGPAVIGVLACAFCLLVFGAGGFLIPAMIVILLVITWNYKRGGEKI